MRTNTKAVVTGDRLGYRRFLETSCDYLCAALTDLLQIRREKAGFSLPYKVYGAESAFLILVSDLFDPVGPPLTLHESLLIYMVRREGTPICLAGVHVMELNRTP